MQSSTQSTQSTTNKYFDETEVSYVQPRVGPEATEQIINPALRGELTEGHAKPYMRSFESYFLRELFCRKVSWAVFTKEWMESLSRFLIASGYRNVLEVCAGRGLLAQHMLTVCPEIIWTATDRDPVDKGPGSPVIQMDAIEAVKLYRPDVVFASWIPYESTLDRELAQLGVPCIFVGEGFGGCTGSEVFWAEQDGYRVFEMPPDFKDLPQWNGIHDYTFCTMPVGKVL